MCTLFLREGARNDGVSSCGAASRRIINMRPLIRQFRCKRALLPTVVVFLVLWVFAHYWSVVDLDQKRISISSSAVNFAKTFIKDDKSADAGAPLLPQPPVILDPLPQVQAPKAVPTEDNTPKIDAVNQNQSVVFPSLPQIVRLSPEMISDGEPMNKTVAAIRSQIREMTKHAWQSYVAHAWGFNELKPVSRAGHQPSVLGTLPLGATIVDSMDTLYIMGLKDEFNKARSYVANELDFSGLTMVSVFEFTIRHLGGLLTAYTFTLDKVFLDKAVELAQRLLPAFNTQTGIPMSLINLKT
ncbi:mannosyl-oligosaccharide alpha-1,2-mannosidase [Paragonimus westermani]|uniref:alpha-1,2-Mannosidase n=1 Tax=Paragonimus westermani TaxID=34504 RepID=A0A5J4NT28_9TREM|nr:mannosyl-oligosaccharide alpha-1,2-mannosidase [Paragonimus westermani]